MNYLISFLLIVGGMVSTFFVFSVKEWLTYYYFDRYKAINKLRGETCRDLMFYADVYGNGYDQLDEYNERARDAIRMLSGRFYEVAMTRHKYLWGTFTEAELKTVASDLLKLSNSRVVKNKKMTSDYNGRDVISYNELLHKKIIGVLKLNYYISSEESPNQP